MPCHEYEYIESQVPYPLLVVPRLASVICLVVTKLTHSLTRSLTANNTLNAQMLMSMCCVVEVAVVALVVVVNP